jgi:hypothetical protein
MIAQHTGEEPECIHERFKLMLLSDESFNSTTEQNTIDFSDYVEAIRNYAMIKRNINIPDPTV